MRAFAGARRVGALSEESDVHASLSEALGASQSTHASPLTRLCIGWVGGTYTIMMRPRRCFMGGFVVSTTAINAHTCVISRGPLPLWRAMVRRTTRFQA